MNRQGYPAVSQCCCHNRNQVGQSLSTGYRQQQAGEQCGVNQEPATYPQMSRHRRNPTGGSNQGNNFCSVIDEQTLNNLAAYRKKACQFITSESDSSQSPSSAPNQQYQYENANQNPYRSSSVLRQANNLIDYAPQSEFLKKMKQQCQYLQNNQPNIFSTLDNFEGHTPHECQRCIDRTKKILTMGEQLRCSRPRSPEMVIRSCSCKQQSRTSGLENQMGARGSDYVCDDNQRLQRDARMLPKSNLDRITEEASERILQKSGRCSGESRPTEKASVHMSRSKKPVKCRERRKRKSDSSEKCESEEEIEPNLKKPHENSCERCWRYASPSRSPVNKPDQRYDPNFRRGHSCADFKQERGDGDLEIVGRPLSPCKNLQPATNREKSPPAQCQSPRQQHSEVMPQNTQCATHRTPQINPQISQYSQQKTHQSAQRPDCCQKHGESQFKEESSFTKVKEVMYNYSRSKSPTKVSPKTQPCESGRKSPTSQGILQADTGRKPRPKSCSTGMSALKSEDLPSYVVDVADYYNICVKAKQGTAQNGADKRSATGGGNSGNRTERPCGGESGYAGPAAAATPRKLASPSTTARPGPAPKASSTPRPGSKPKTARSPDQCAPGPSTMADGPKEGRGGSPKARTPKTPAKQNVRPGTPANLNVRPGTPANQNVRPGTPANQNVRPGTPGTDSTVYAEVSAKKTAEPCSPKKSPAGQPQKTQNKSPSPKSKSNNGKSPRRGSKSSPKRSPKRVQSSSDCTENSTLSQGDRPQTVFPPVAEYERILNAERAQKYPGVHPVRECYCPPRAPFPKDFEGDPEHVFCCHCNWEEKLKNQEQGNECNDGQLENDPDNLSTYSNKNYCAPEDVEVACPYRTYQRDRIAVNDLSWQEDHKQIADFCSKNPHMLDSALRKQWLRDVCGVEDSLDTPQQTPQQRHQHTPQQKPHQTPQQMPQQRSQNSSTKYTVMYMTQNKLDKGGDVEVLVEELTQACPNSADSRTRDITEKMKRIMQRPSDSMALRFQKGVSESCRTPHSSRILYF